MEIWNKNWVLSGLWLGVMATVGYISNTYAGGLYCLLMWTAGELIIWGWNEI